MRTVLGSRGSENMDSSIAPEVAPAWREEHFEYWFDCTNPSLSGCGSVLVVSLPRPCTHMVDIIGLDADGGMAMIEVKNELATRATVGQALEYLAKYSEIQVEDLADEFEVLGRGNLFDAYKRKFQKPLEALSARRRIYLAAPDFTPYSQISAQYLSGLLEPHSISIHLLRIKCTSRDPWLFEIESKPVNWTQARDLRGVITTASGRCYRVLVAGARPIVWLMGTLDDQNELVRPSATKLTRLVKVRSKPGLPDDRLAELLDESQVGTVWRKERHESNKRSRLLGIVQYRDGPRAVLGQFVGSAFDKFRLIPLDEFKDNWRRASGTVPEPPDWNTIAA